jgi:hypothetical protein
MVRHRRSQSIPEYSLTITIQRSKYIDPSRTASFRQACNQASRDIIQSILKPFLATWETNLMGSDLENLQSIAEDPRLSGLVEMIIIHDDCENLDPYATRILPTIGHPYTIWPRDETGRVISSETGIESLERMLRTRQLRPKTIKIRDYHICKHNLCYAQSDPELIYAGDLVLAQAPSWTSSCSVAVMARDLVRDANVSITSLAIQYTEWPIGELPSELDTPFTMDSRLYHGRMIANSQVTSLGGPSVTEATIKLSPEYKGQKTDFSSLGSVELRLGQQDAADYWLEQIFYEAPALESIKMSCWPSYTTSLIATMVVAALAEFEICCLSTSAEQILAMLACSKESLTRIDLRSISLDDEGPTWNELLSLIAKRFTALTSFRVSFLSRDRDHSASIDFYKTLEHIPQEFRAGLKFRAKAPEKRVMGMSYDGPNAAALLGVLGRHGHMQTWAQIEERRAEAIAAESGGVVSTA